MTERQRRGIFVARARRPRGEPRQGRHRHVLASGVKRATGRDRRCRSYRSSGWLLGAVATTEMSPLTGLGARSWVEQATGLCRPATRRTERRWRSESVEASFPECAVTERQRRGIFVARARRPRGEPRQGRHRHVLASGVKRATGRDRRCRSYRSSGWLLGAVATTEMSPLTGLGARSRVALAASPAGGTHVLDHARAGAGRMAATLTGRQAACLHGLEGGATACRSSPASGSLRCVTRGPAWELDQRLVGADPGAAAAEGDSAGGNWIRSVRMASGLLTPSSSSSALR